MPHAWRGPFLIDEVRRRNPEDSKARNDCILYPWGIIGSIWAFWPRLCLLRATRVHSCVLSFTHVPLAACSFRRLSCTVSRLRGSVRVFASSLCTSLRAWVSPFHCENVKMRLEHKHHPPPPPPPPLPPRPPPPPPPHASHHPFFCNKAGEAVPCREDNRASRVVVWAGDLPFVQVVCARARRQP